MTADENIRTLLAHIAHLRLTLTEVVDRWVWCQCDADFCERCKSKRRYNQVLAESRALANKLEVTDDKKVSQGSRCKGRH